MVKENNKEIFMKKLVKTAMFFFTLLLLINCKTREKQTQKSENHTETKSEATVVSWLEKKLNVVSFQKSIFTKVKNFKDGQVD